MVSLETAMAHLRVQAGAGSPDSVSIEVADKLAQAHAIVFDYIARPADDTWSAEMASWQGSPEVALPYLVAAAVLIQLGELWRFRGDDEAGPERAHGDLSMPVAALLRRYRDPVVV